MVRVCLFDIYWIDTLRSQDADDRPHTGYSLRIEWKLL